ncbi:hypothetical protein [Sphingomonas sp. 1185]|uniref:hypothetical protein n=1 Tax=Sphingomonas sp. 1185 TaxID=3156411 RepID=UPI003398E507
MMKSRILAMRRRCCSAADDRRGICLSCQDESGRAPFAIRFVDRLPQPVPPGSCRAGLFFAYRERRSPAVYRKFPPL